MRFVRHAVPILALLCLAAHPLAAQNTGTVKGQVADSTTKQALSGVSVQVQGTTRSTTTGTDGSYTLADVPAGSVVVRATRIGFGPQQQIVNVTAGAIAEARFELAPQAALLEAVVVTGYGTTRREAITGSVASVDANAARVGVQTNVTQMIQGRAAGVEVIQNNGEPGAGSQILIRGGSSVSARNDPLYVIDGVPIANVATEPDGNGWTGSPSLGRNPLNMLNPGDIQSITVLKDASATAIYGSRASNGVVLIETKRGQASSGPVFEYDGYVSTASPARHLDVLNGSEYQTFIRDQVTAGNLPASALGSLGILESTGPLPSDTTRVIYNTNWEQQVTRSAVTYNQNLAFSGGTEDTHYRGSLNYAKEEGVALSSGLERIQGRLSANHSDLDGRLRVGLNVTSSRVNNNYLTYENQGGFEGGVFENVAVFNPTKPVTVTDSTGTRYYEVGGTTVRNPVALANQITDVGSTTRTLGNADAEYDLVHGLTAKINVGVDQSSGARQEYYPKASPLGVELGNGLAQQQTLENRTRTLQTLLTYDGNRGSTSINVVGGYEYSNFKNNYLMGRGTGFFTDAYTFNSLNAAQSTKDSSYAAEAVLASFFGRANLGFNERFFLTGVLRYDGSSRFAEGHKWALFPGLSGSWNLKKEGFMEGGPFSDFKLRLGWGLQGNPGVDPYTSLITLASGSSAQYPWGDNGASGSGVLATSNGNPNLKWEQTSQIDAAIDFGLMDNKISGTVEYYNKHTNDLLLTVDVPQPAYTSSQLKNVGKLAGHGLEIALDAVPVSHPGLTWRAGIVFAADRSKVTDLGCTTDSTGTKSCPFYDSGNVSGQGQSGVSAERVMVCDPSQPGHCPGYALGTFYGPVFLDVDQATGKQVFFCTAATVGCVNGRTTTGSQPAAADYRVIGNANPDFTLAFHSSINWNRFDISFLVRAVVGQDVFNNTSLVYGSKSAAVGGANFLRVGLTDGVGINEPSVYSSRYIENASFVRLQNITIGYDLNVPWLMKTARSAHLYVSADNLFLITGYSGLDPEVYSGTGLAVRGIDYLVYPRPRVITGGLRLNF